MVCEFYQSANGEKNVADVKQSEDETQSMMMIS